MRKIRTPNTDLGDANARKKLEKAAKAIGVKVEELADLAADAGFRTPPTDVIPDRFTLEDLGKRLHADLTGKPRDARAAWFAALLPIQQHAIVTTLRERGFSSFAIAHDFNIAQRKVASIYSEHAEKLGVQIAGTRIETILGTLEIAAEKAQAIALEDRDASTYWRVARERVGLLQSLGVVEQARRKVEVHHHLHDARQAEIAGLVDLETKKRARLEELKRVDHTVVETLPSGFGLSEAGVDDDDE